jgi:hypothetical protein
MKADHLYFHRALGYSSNEKDYLLATDANKGCELMVYAINGVGKVYITTFITGLLHDSAIIRREPSEARGRDEAIFGSSSPRMRYTILDAPHLMVGLLPSLPCDPERSRLTTASHTIRDHLPGHPT